MEDTPSAPVMISVEHPLTLLTTLSGQRGNLYGIQHHLYGIVRISQTVMVDVSLSLVYTAPSGPPSRLHLIEVLACGV